MRYSINNITIPNCYNIIIGNPFHMTFVTIRVETANGKLLLRTNKPEVTITLII